MIKIIRELIESIKDLTAEIKQLRAELPEIDVDPDYQNDSHSYLDGSRRG